MSQPDQLVPYFDSVAKQFLGPGGVPSGSIEVPTAWQPVGASATIPMGIATRPGIIRDARIAAVTAPTGNATYTVDIRKNGVTILTAPMALLVATASMASIVGNLAVPNAPVAIGDFFTAVCVLTIGTGAAPINVIAQVQLILN